MSEPSYSSPPRSPLEIPRPGWGEILRSGLVVGFVGGIALSLLVAITVVAWAAWQGETARFSGLAAIAGWALVAGFVVFFIAGIMRRSRALQDRAFTLTGFLATFFGLGMLVIFFWGLLADVAAWFYYTPILVEQNNREILEKREEFKKVQSLRDLKKAELDAAVKEAMDAATTAEERREAIKLFFGPPEVVEKLGAKEQEELKVVKTAEEKAKIQTTYDNLIKDASRAWVKEMEEREQAEREKAKTPAEKDAVRDRYNSLITLQGGVYADTLRSDEARLADSKRLADLPLRDLSPLSVLGHFLFETPSNEPQAVGIKPALFGSLWLAILMMIFAVPIGVGAAIYLEEYKTTGRLGRFIQLNINNLAGVPSIIYGILGAWVFVELIFKPLHRLHEGISVRNVIGGGMTLGLLTLPVIIVAAQEAIRAVPNSIRQGAYALGATQWQTIRHQVLPLARPGIMTGTILAVSRAIGEAAPLVLFGATTFIAYTPTPVSEFTVLPIQIFNWAERPTNPVFDSIAVAEGKTIRLLEPLTRQETRRIQEPASIKSVAFTMDGKRMLAGREDGVIRIWNMANWRAAELKEHTSAVTSLDVSGDSRYFISAADRMVILWDRTDDRLRWVAKLPHERPVTAVRLTNKGGKAITADADGKIRIWETGLGVASEKLDKDGKKEKPAKKDDVEKAVVVKLLQTLDKHAGAVHTLSVSPENDSFASAGADQLIVLWELATGKEIKTIKGHTRAVTSVAFSPSGEKLASGGVDRHVFVWDLVKGDLWASFDGHQDAVTAVGFNAKGTDLVSAARDGAVKVWPLAKVGESPDPVTFANLGSVTTAAYNPTGRMIDSWHQNMALASLVLLIMLLILNACAIYVRNRAQRRVRW